MLVLTRHVGEQIYIGDAVCLTVVGRLCGSVFFEITALRTMRVEYDESTANAEHTLRDDSRYLFSLHTGESVRVGDAVILLCGHPRRKKTRGRQIRIGIEAPKSTAILRSEIAHRHHDGHARSPGCGLAGQDVV
jgi:sRNA-binding carbon storage regulator CsrA